MRGSLRIRDLGNPEEKKKIHNNKMFPQTKRNSVFSVFFCVLCLVHSYIILKSEGPYSKGNLISSGIICVQELTTCIGNTRNRTPPPQKTSSWQTYSINNLHSSPRWCNCLHFHKARKLRSPTALTQLYLKRNEKTTRENLQAKCRRS